MAAVAAGDAEMPEVGADGGGAGGAVDGAGGDPEPKESAAEAQERFEVELEFVQCLANPKYLMCTSHRASYVAVVACIHVVTSVLFVCRVRQT